MVSIDGIPIDDGSLKNKKQINVRDLKEYLESLDERAIIEIVIEDKFDKKTRELDSVEEFKSVDRKGNKIHRVYLKG